MDDIDDYVEIDSCGTVINTMRLKEATILHNGNKTIRSPGNGVSVGWKYINDTFVDPNPVIPFVMPAFQPSSEQEEIATLKADIQNLSASLTQVINAFNSLTKPATTPRK
jgi:hypothetical protein